MEIMKMQEGSGGFFFGVGVEGGSVWDCGRKGKGKSSGRDIIFLL